MWSYTACIFTVVKLNSVFVLLFNVFVVHATVHVWEFLKFCIHTLQRLPSSTRLRFRACKRLVNSIWCNVYDY